MRIPHILYGRRKRGVSTILGTLIFIGILFTSVVPMMLVMKQADTIYTQRVHEMEAKDEERNSEVLEAYAYPINETSDQLKVRAKNIGIVPVKIVRVWINDANHSTSATIKSQETKILGPFTVSLVNNGSYVAKLTTDRGNCFPSTSGTLYFTDGYWFTPSLGVHVLVLNWWGKYQIYVYNSTWSSPDPYESQHTEFGDIEWTEVVESPGDYWVAVRKKIGSDWVHLPSSPVPIVIQWPGGSPVVNVIADGRGF